MVDEEDVTRIGMVLFPNLTSLDLVGPYEVLGASPKSKIDLLWHDLSPVAGVGGLAISPTATFDDYAPPDVLFVPGGPGQLQAMEDEPLLEFIRKSAASASYVTSVCTGSLILAAAGLLRGKRATCHWASLDQLALMGATPVSERVVEDGNIITGAGVTSGIDFAFVVAAKLWGEGVARRIQLRLEYDPDPPFSDGSVKSADPEIVAEAVKNFGPFSEKRREVASRIGREKLGIEGV